MLRKKALIITPKIPDLSGNKHDARFYHIIAALSEIYEVHCVYIQSLFSQDASIKRIERLGVKVFSFRNMKQKAADKKVSVPQYLIEQNNYEMILFSTYFAAKFYMLSLMTFSPGSMIVIDAGKSNYMAERKYALRSPDPIEGVMMLRRSGDSSLKEIPLYNKADLIIVASGDEKAILANDIAHDGIRVVSGGGDIADVCSAIDVFNNIPIRKNGSGRNNIDFVAIQAGSKGNHSSGNTPASISGLIVMDKDAVIVGGGDDHSFTEKINRGLGQFTRDYMLIAVHGAIIPEQSINSLYSCARCHPSHGVIIPAFFVSNDHAAHSEILSAAALHHAANFGKWESTAMARGKCFFVKREVIDNIGFFDTRFSLFSYAFFDFSLKALRAGYKTIVDYEACVFYGEHGSEDNGPQAQRDRELFLSKWCDAGAGYLEQL